MVPESPGLIYLPWPGVGRVFGGKVQQRNASIDTAEVARFDAAAEAWWDPEGEARWLHRYNPVRLDYIRRAGCRQFGVDSLKGLRILDIGCGAGVLCEPLARLGAAVVGVEPGESNIVMARRHAREAGLSIDYRCTTAEALADAGERFDIVLAMEVVEHVADAPAFLALRLAGEAGRADDPVHHQPHAQELRLCHRRGGICFPPAAARRAPMAPLRDPARGRARRSPPAD
jgi:SAM-dependent methyltransferase